jgi:hypothetical protein
LSLQKFESDPQKYLKKGRKLKKQNIENKFDEILLFSNILFIVTFQLIN